MSVGLFDAVVNESYQMPGTETVDSVIESEVEERITDDPATMMEYTGECMMAMLATEAAVAKMEGVNAVNYLLAKEAGDEATMEATIAAMEGFLGDVWETLKEWIKKAFTAIKNFLIKVWNRMKGYAGQVQAFFTKYDKVLANKRVPGLMVDWCRINIVAARNGFETIHRRLNQVAGQVLRVEYIEAGNNAISRGIHRAVGADEERAYKHDTHGAGPASQNIRDTWDRDIPSAKAITDAIEEVVYPNGKTDRQVSFESIRRDAIQAADISSYKKYIDFHLRLGDSGMQESLKCVNDCQKDLRKLQSQAKQAGVSKLHAYARRIMNAQVSLHRICTSIMATAAKRAQSQAVRACRKAIMYHSTEGEGATETEESFVPNAGFTVDGLMAEML